MNGSFPLRVATAALVLVVTSVSAQTGGAGTGRASLEQATGPVVAVDEAHKNVQRSDFRGFVELLGSAGYRPRRFTEAMTAASLTGVDVLMISNPGGWEEPSASLSEGEVSAVIEWVKAGGSLLLLLDHMPGPRNAARLTTALGARNWDDGYAMVDVPDSLPVGNIIFRRSGSFSAGEPVIGSTGPGGGVGYQGIDAVLADHPIANGCSPDNRVRNVATFVGSAFQPPPLAETLLTMPRRAISLKPPEVPGVRPVFNAQTPRTSVDGWVQGAVMKFGKGRVALFGETGLFSGGPAADNRMFLLNLLRWLTGRCDGGSPPNER